MDLIKRSIATAIALCLLLCTADAAQADALRTIDGQWWPKGIQEAMRGLDAPSDAVLQTCARHDLVLSYDEVTLGSQRFDAAEVDEFYATAAYANAAFLDGERQGLSRYWAEAARSFASAAEDLRGAAREIALHKRVLCLAAANDAQGTFEAAKALLDAFPKSFFFAGVQDTRARILITQGEPGKARAALQQVVDAPGMNLRDAYGARVGQVYLFAFKTAGRDSARYAAARGAYEAVLGEIEARKATRLARIPWLTSKVGVGKCHLFEGSPAKALPFFDEVIEAKESRGLEALLAQAYTGRADARHAAIKRELRDGGVGADQLARVTQALDDVALDYLRVCTLYFEHAGDELYPARLGLARAWATQFHLAGEKDCELARRACTYYFAAHRMLPPGEARRLLTIEVRRFRDKRDEACGLPD